MSNSASPSLAEVQSAIEDSLSPGHFFVPPGTVLRSAHVAQEEIPWEIFRGRLLDPAHTRCKQVFESWTVEPALEPACHVSVKLAFDAGTLHVTRGILCHVWEGYDSGNNVIESRETSRIVEELIGMIPLDHVGNMNELRNDVARLVFRAVVGLSKLPLSSIEAPIPAFSLGHFAYFSGPPSQSDVLHNAGSLIQEKLGSDQDWLTKVKLLEFALRATPMPDIPEMASIFSRRWQETWPAACKIATLIRTLFNEVALSPYTDFVDKFLAFARCLSADDILQTAEHVDLLGHLLRQTARHLTAYDLVTFHNRGANYPDALFLDAVLSEYVRLAESHAELFQGDNAGRIRRRALRQGWLLRKLCVGVPVPEAPTSPGENARVLPAPFQRVSAQEIDSPGGRKKHLFAECSFPVLSDRALALLKESLADLRNDKELRELGIGLFLDRPMGRFKAVGEPDLTPLFSYPAFSASIATKRLELLRKEFPDVDWPTIQLHPEIGHGIRLQPSGRPVRPASVCLDDCFKVADDFVLWESTRGSVREFLDSFDFTLLSSRFAIEFLAPESRPLIVSADSVGGSPADGLHVYDEQKRLRLVLRFDGSGGYRRHIDREVPAAGLTANYIRAVNHAGEFAEHNLKNEETVLWPRI